MFMILAETTESVKVIKDAGNIMFYVLLVALAITVFVICWIFMRNKKFKVKERERDTESDDYVPPTVFCVDEGKSLKVDVAAQERASEQSDRYDGKQQPPETNEG